MYNKTIKNITILNLIIGAVLAVLALLPFMTKMVLFILLFFVGLTIILYLRQKQLLQTLTLKESLTIGAISGFISFIGFSAIFIPLVYLLNLFIPIAHMGGFVLMLKLSNIGLIVMFTLFLSTISILFNAFITFLWYCLSYREENKLIEPPKTFEEQLKENNKNIH